MMSDYKGILDEHAEEIAQQNYGKGFYDLSEELQEKVYAEAEERYAGNFLSQIDSMKGRK